MRLFKFADELKIDFVKGRYLAFVVTGIMVLGSVGLLVTKGLNYGIDFSGGIMMEIQTPVLPDLSKMRSDLNGLGLGNISIQEFGTDRDVLIRVPEQAGGEDAQKHAIESIKASIDAEYTQADGVVEYRRSEYVGPQVGDELKKSGMWAFLLTVAGILGYIWYRFEWQFGVAAILTLVHDTTAVIGLFSLLWMNFDLGTLAAVLLVAGYSTNDTVIVFDRIRENRRKFKKMQMRDVINMSLNQTLARTLNTSFTTLLSLGALWLFGGEVIRDFVNAMIFGIVVGTYSSIYVASSSLLYFPFEDSKKRGDAPDDGEGDDTAEESVPA
ncbi:MAG: protein translocase subunit SecF [Alphaproteobacteria bacterium]|jgi:preprotein translocase subunit SecF|nr:protein translocase subunit SecF [Alphaproteobacteria bacterium]MCB1551494.1 protein translocase subunit SecF [Alphaproteobacteria bacterium]MCB9985061.1 protein translocase subunit SecF [Micavibrio sp.]HPQ50801.1 protein translocase subunit SecF [Alphaproteobacteria bacterium]HRK97443.1 protein translocase subunit SecF [Alphaproteobacteria bacterium]